MPKLVHSSQLTVHRILKTVNRELMTVNWRQRRHGFTLIELLIVISIFGLTASLITASYLTFERNQRLKAAAQKIKTDVRFTQNEALSGNKGIGTRPSACLEVTPTTLVGYYMQLTAEGGKNDGYTLRGYCLGSADNFDFNIRAVSLPQGVKISL